MLILESPDMGNEGTQSTVLSRPSLPTALVDGQGRIFILKCSQPSSPSSARGLAPQWWAFEDLLMTRIVIYPESYRDGGKRRKEGV